MRRALPAIAGIVAFIVVMAVALAILGGSAGTPEIAILAVVAALCGLIVSRSVGRNRGRGEQS